MPIPVKCSNCGKTLNVPDSMAGKKGKCPKCKKVILVPTADAEAASDAGGGEGAGAKEAGGSACPNCGKKLEEGDVFCIGCGTNIKTGKRIDGV